MSDQDDMIEDFPTAVTLRPAQAIAEALKDADILEDVMIIGITKDGCCYCVHSQMLKERALFILEIERGRIMASNTASALVTETAFGDFIPYV